MSKKKLAVGNYQGRSTFMFILNQVKDCIKDIQLFFEDLEIEKIYTSEYLDKAQSYFLERPKISVNNMALFDIAYLIVYYGASYLDMNGLLRLLNRYYNSELTRRIATYISLKPHKDSSHYPLWDNMKDIQIDIIDFIHNNKAVPFYVKPSLDTLVKENYFKYYGGHQYKLGHYYRHLFQSVKYINEQKILTYKEKYDYVKTLRAQISSPEQYLIFFNSISSLGRAWEFDRIEEKCYDNYLITKYNLIKNIPDLYLFNAINIPDYYPLVNYELSNKPTGRIEIESIFK